MNDKWKKQGIVYKVEVGDKVYYGSTTQKLCNRQARHNFNLKQKNGSNFYKECLKQKIEKIICKEIYRGGNYIQKENEYIINNECLNSIKAFTNRLEDKKKYYNDNKHLWKDYYKDNKDKWNTEDKKNKTEIRVKQKITCDICGKEMLKYSLNRHKKIHST